MNFLNFFKPKEKNRLGIEFFIKDQKLTKLKFPKNFEFL